MKKKFATYGVVIATLLGSMPAMADITLGVFPRRPAAASFKAFKPLADKLSKELGEKVNLRVAKDFPTFWKGVENQEYDLVHYNQYHYLLSKKKYGYKVIAANEENGKRTIAGSLSVRKDSGINKVSDLKGKTILFGGGKKAMGSYIAATEILKRAGLIAGKDYTEKFAKNPPSAVIATYNKVADAAGAGDIILEIPSVTQKINVKDMKILATSDRFVQLPWAVKGDMPASKVAKIQSIMTGMKKGDPVLKAAKVTGFFKVTDADFNKVKEIVKFAIGQDL